MNIITILILIATTNNYIAEDIYNVGKSKYKTCGQSEDCVIICDVINACVDTTFDVFNNDITIICSGKSSCDQVQIAANNVSSLNLTLSGDSSFINGRLFIDSLSRNINVTCNGISGCYMSIFHYNTNSNIIHNCYGDLSCESSIVHAIDDANIIIYCDGEISFYPCTSMIVILPTSIRDKGYVNVIAVGDVAANASTEELSTYYPMYILSLYSIDPYNITCKNASNCSLDNIWILYGIEFSINNACKASNKTCIQEAHVQINNSNTVIIDTHIDYYPDDLDFSDYIISDDVLLILWNNVVSSSRDESVTYVYSPTMNNEMSSFSLICFECHGMSINLTKTQNSIVTSFFGMDLSTFYGPKRSMIINEYGYQITSEYYLEFTDMVTINGISNYNYDIDHLDFSDFNFISLGDCKHLQLTCNFWWDCTNLLIVTFLDPTFVNNGFNDWNINIQSGHNEDSSYESININFVLAFWNLYECYNVNTIMNCINELHSNNYNLTGYKMNISVIYTISNLRESQQDKLIENYKDQTSTEITEYSIERINVLLKISYMNAIRLQNAIPDRDIIQFEDFLLIFDKVTTENEDSLKIEARVASIHDLVENDIYVLSQEKKETFISQAEQAFHRGFNNNKINVDVEIVESLSPLPVWVIPLSTSAGSLLILIIIIELIKYIYRKLKEEYIINPLVLLIGIGEYDSYPKKPDLVGKIEDISHAINIDIQNLNELFTNLNYQIISDNNKIHWTQTELMERLEVTAKILNDDKHNKFDSLIVIISCHGISNNILTSDYQLINKDAIHRLFSLRYSKIREIPRIFIFDCCDGSYSKQNEKEEEKEKGKHFNVEHIERVNSYVWGADEVNPDFKLVIINGANTGFQSKIHETNGSYLISEIKKRIQKSIDDNIKCWKKNKNISKIFNNIQQYLHKKGKQQIVNTFNNNTSHLIFKKNSKKTQNINIELIQISHKNKNKFVDEQDHDADDNSLSDLYEKKLIDSNKILNKIKKLVLQNKDEQYIQNEIKNSLSSKNRNDKELNELIEVLILFIKNTDANKDYHINKQQKEEKEETEESSENSTLNKAYIDGLWSAYNEIEKENKNNNTDKDDPIDGCD